MWTLAIEMWVGSSKQLVLSPLDDCGLLGGMSAGQVEARDERSVHREEPCVAADATLSCADDTIVVDDTAVVVCFDGSAA